MTFINTCADVDDLGGGRFRHTQHIKPVAYDDNGTLRAIGSAFTASGKADRPHAVRAARLMTSVADDGMRRIHPTREEDRYVEIGAPYVKIGGVWRKMGFRGGMRAANRLTWASPQANMSIVHAGHYIKLEIELKRGYVPEDGLVAFPVGLNGLKRSGTDILCDGRTVMSLRAPQMYDAANEMDTRAIDAKFVSLVGQPYYLMALPDLTGMSRPVIDPTLTLQPDAAAGMDGSVRSDTANRDGSSDIYTALANSSAKYYGLIRFDVSEIPALATVISASLTLTNSFTTETNTTHSIHSILAANNGWLEACSWNYADGAGASDRWAGDVGADGGADAGCSVSGTDYNASAMGMWPYAAGTPANTAHEIILDLAQVAAWIAGANYGAWYKVNEWAIENGWVSSDHATAKWRPKLVIEYSLPGGGNIFQSAILHSSLYGKTLVR